MQRIPVITIYEVHPDPGEPSSLDNMFGWDIDGVREADGEAILLMLEEATTEIIRRSEPILSRIITP